MIERLLAALAAELPAAVELRHELHAHPQLSGAEGPTTARVLAALGWGEGEPVAGTGALVAPHLGAVVLRAELDGLPVTEDTDVPWRATGPVMHACGHDVHLAALVAACRTIAACSPDVPVAALLQPREESAPSGAADVVAAGVLDRHRVRAVLGAHVQPRLPVGVVNVTPGTVNAAADEFEIVVHGRGGHAAYPHTVRDPVLGSAAVVLALQQLAARRADPVRGTVCTVGAVHGGTAPNVVPDSVTLTGSARVMVDADRAPTLDTLEQIAADTARAYGCRAEVSRRGGEPPVVNDPELARRAAATLAAAGIAVDSGWRSFGSDDFAWYGSGSGLPALMAFVGVGNGGSDGGLRTAVPASGRDGGGRGPHLPRLLRGGRCRTGRRPS